jgi:hypothetical protein
MATKKKAAEATAAAKPKAATRTTATRATSAAQLRGNPLPGTGQTAAPAKQRPFKVEAIQMGFYDLKRRRPGDVFMVEPAMFSEKWMRRVDPATPEKITTGNQDLRKQHDEILQQKIKDSATNGPDAGSGPNPIDA